ncbi:MAG: hypothetical protein J4432_00075 [DPANN group archaeon]|nr:hypothetical protein [DPANN group archaeon]
MHNKQMLIQHVAFEETPSQVAIRGFLEKHPKTQVANATLVFGEKHAQHAIIETRRAFAEKRNISKTEEMEFLLRLMGVRQINKALEAALPNHEAVFISWSENAKESYDDFLAQFGAKHAEAKAHTQDEVLDAIEQTSTFWLNN